MLNGTFCTADTKALAKRERDPICDVCGHNHVQGVKCDICGHVGKYIGATQPAGAPVTTGLAASNLTANCLCLACRQFLVDPIDRTVALSRRCLRAPCMRRISHHPQLKGSHPQVTAQLPVELRNLDQLKVLLDTLPDYHSEDEQPSYVLAIPCRPIVIGLSVVLPSMPCLSTVNWSRLGAPG
jgi:hypothetical protein